MVQHGKAGRIGSGCIQRCRRLLEIIHEGPAGRPDISLKQKLGAFHLNSRSFADRRMPRRRSRCSAGAHFETLAGRHRRGARRPQFPALFDRLDRLLAEFLRSGGGGVVDGVGPHAFDALAGDRRVDGRRAEHRADAARRRHRRSLRPIPRASRQLRPCDIAGRRARGSRLLGRTDDRPSRCARFFFMAPFTPSASPRNLVSCRALSSVNACPRRLAFPPPTRNWEFSSGRRSPAG
jgi:hypothetical protein